MLAILVGLKKKFYSWPVAILAAASRAARPGELPPEPPSIMARRRGYWPCSRWPASSAIKVITGQQAKQQSIGRPLRGKCNLAVCLPVYSISLSISLSLLQQRKSCRRITGGQEDEAPKRGRGGGARESRHVAKAPPKSGLAGKGAPGRRERRLRGPWRWTLEAWPRCWRTLREPPTAAAPSRRVWGSPHGGFAGPGGC